MVSELLFLMLAWRTYFGIQKHWTSIFCYCSLYIASPWGNVVLQMDIIKGGNKSTVIDASRSYLAVLYPLILSPTFRFQQVASCLWLCADINPWVLLCYPNEDVKQGPGWWEFPEVHTHSFQHLLVLISQMRKLRFRKVKAIVFAVYQIFFSSPFKCCSTPLVLSIFA